jgi:ComF family protein
VALIPYASRMLRALLGLLYPPHCVACGADIRSSEAMLCGHCLGRLELVGEHACSRCGSPVGDHTGTESCPQCEGRELGFSRAAAACRYGGLARDLILEFKYGRRTILSRALASLMVECALKRGFLDRADAVVAVPLHERKLRHRGFNQADALAERISSRSGRPQLRNALVRVEDTRAQTGLDRESRLANVNGAFAVRDDSSIRGAHILLVDDVMTTGSTLSECAAALRRAGAAEVTVLVAARD